MPRTAITGASGKIGGAILQNLLKHDLAQPADLIVTTSRTPFPAELSPFAAQGVTIRHATFTSPSTLAAAYAGCDHLVLVSSPDIAADWTPGTGGREALHIAAIEAAREAGVGWVVYTSLGFGDESRAGVMRAHNATERYLGGMQGGMGWTVIREGLYCESWPLYLGHGDMGGRESRGEVVLRDTGEGRVCWAAIADLGLATAVVVAGERGEWEGRTVVLNGTEGFTLKEVAGMVGEARGWELKVRSVSREEHVEYYVGERGMERGLVEWWVSTYEAIAAGETDNKDDTLEKILDRFGRKPKSLRETIGEMVKGSEQ